MPCRYEGKIAVRGSLRRVAVKYAPCGWAVVQLDFDGGDISEYRMYGIILEYTDQRRTIGKAEMWAFYMALVRLSGFACIYTDTFSFVQALKCQSSA